MGVPAPGATTGVVANVLSSASSVSVFPASLSYHGRTVYNDSTAILYLSLSATAASTTSYTVQVASQGYYEVPGGYSGAIQGIWASANGAARITWW